MLLIALTTATASKPFFSLARARSLARSVSMMTAESSFADWTTRFDNSLLRDLQAESSSFNPHQSRQVLGAHYTRVRPTVSAPLPKLVVHSTEVAASLGLSDADCKSEEFLTFFAGSVPDEVETWATAYGASFTGRYGGQRGDGRAISVGQLAGQELQLKGAGVTPYSRQFDGRAVLRSSVREFLVCEAMAALRVPTTRALCVISTGESVPRAWYDDEGRERMTREPGAVGARVSSSFIRFGQFELFYHNEDVQARVIQMTQPLPPCNLDTC